VIQRGLIASTTGHRPDKLGGYAPNPIGENAFWSAWRALDHLQPKKVRIGMALGWDQLVAWACLDLGIPYTACIPFKTQAQLWSKEQQLHYRELLYRAEDRIVVCPGGYSPYKMQVRNVYMVDNSDYLIACWNGSDGGTKNAVDYARVKEKDILILNPMVPYEQQNLPPL
jgi:uncharacterized phage-like protein YoqJ